MSTGLAHREGSPEEFSHVESQQSGGNQTEIGEHGITSTDVRRIGECSPKSAFPRELLQSRAGIGNGDKLCSASISLGAMNELPEVGQQRHDLNGSAGFARDKKQRPRRLNHLGDLAHPTRHGGVQYPESWCALCRAEGAAKNLRAQAAATHSKEHDIGRVGLADGLRRGPQVGQPVLHVVEDCQPA